MKLLPLLVIGLSLSLVACGKDQDRRETRAHKALQVHREHKASKGSPVLKVKQEPKVPKDLREHRATRVRKAIRVKKAIRAIRARAIKVTKEKRATPGPKGDKGDPGITNVRAVQMDGAVTCEANETLVSVFCPSGGAVDGAKCATAPTVGLCLKALGDVSSPLAQQID